LLGGLRRTCGVILSEAKEAMPASSPHFVQGDKEGFTRDC
jgi:hypothetical protein